MTTAETNERMRLAIVSAGASVPRGLSTTIISELNKIHGAEKLEGMAQEELNAEVARIKSIVLGV